MKSWHLPAWSGILACLVLMAMMTTATMAGPTVRLTMKDGSHWKGEVGSKVEVVYSLRNVESTIVGRLNKVADRYIEVEGVIAGIKSKKIIMRSDLVSITTAGAPVAGGVTADSTSPDMPKPDLPKAGPKGPKPNLSGRVGSAGVFMLPLEGTVGIEFRHNEMLKIAAEADKLGPGQIIVLKINSPGGLVIEGEDIHRTLVDIGRRHRVVAWIEEAISGGCAAAICCNEIYFMTEGTAGSVTMFSGTTAATGAELQAWLHTLGTWMEEGGRHRYIAEAMIHAPLMLSYDKDPRSGDIIWHNDLSGSRVLSREGENLTFNSTNAVACGFAQGIADTEEELATLLGLSEWKELGDGVGRKISENWLRTAKRGQDEIPKIILRLNRSGVGRDAEATIGRQITLWRQLIGWNSRARRISEFQGVPDTQQILFTIEELKRALAQLRDR